ncbi:MAG: hypothetical protein RL885_03060 [Planctomycetota bacterium]
MSRLAALTVLALAVAASAGAHPWHSSFAEMELNPKTGKLEVALCVSPLQLEEALRRLSKTRLVLEDREEKVDAWIVKYLEKTFRVEQTSGELAEIEWVGKEVGVKQAWLYFEMPLEGGLIGSEISQQTFLELAEDQTNVIELKQGQRKATLKFERQRPKLRIGKKPEEDAKGGRAPAADEKAPSSTDEKDR